MKFFGIYMFINVVCPHFLPSQTIVSKQMSSSSAPVAAGTAPKVTLHKLYPIGFYTAESAGSICSICKLTLEEQCPTCAANPTDEDCVSTANESCGHRLHVHCIDGWLRKTTKCPVCDHEWNAPIM